MGVGHGEGVGGLVHHLEVVEEVAEHHRLVPGDAQGLLDVADPAALVRVPVHDVEPVLAGDHHHGARLGEQGQVLLDVEEQLLQRRQGCPMPIHECGGRCTPAR